MNKTMTDDIDAKLEEEIEHLKNYRGASSRLRREITKVSALTDHAVKILNRHLQGEAVDKELVADAKWTLSMIRELYDTAIREETVKVRKNPPKPLKDSKSLKEPKQEKIEKGKEPESGGNKAQTKPKMSLTMGKAEPTVEPKAAENAGEDLPSEHDETEF